MPTRWLLALAWTMTAAGAATIVPNGSISDVALPGAPPVAEISLAIPQPGWGAYWFDQRNAAPVEAAEADGVWSARWSVPVQSPAGAGELALEQRVEIAADRVAVTWRVTPSVPLSSEGVRVMVSAPTDALAGRGAALLGVGERALSVPLPAEKPSPYHLGSAPNAQWMAWRRGDEVLRVDWPGELQVAVQDNREFGQTAFQAQLAVPGSNTLPAGGTVEVSVTLAPTTPAAIADEGVLVLEADDLWATARVETAATGELAIGEVAGPARETARWWPIELRFPVSGTWDNPFDPAQIDVHAIIEGPDGRRVQPAFYYQDFAPLPGAGPELLEPRGAPEWRLRWTPLVEGEHRVTLEATSAGRTVTRDAGVYTATPARTPGFVRRAADTPYYLAHDDGTPYLALGPNICWDGDTPLAAYADWFGKLGRAGGNFARIWLVRWNLALEWTNLDPRALGHYSGLGRYSLDNAWRLDQLLDLAAANGIHLMLALGYHGELMPDSENDYFSTACWKYNPYNAALGGPCAAPADFWTDPRARQLYQQRLRYFVARWGASPNVMAWEFWNEVRAPAPWVDEMATWLGEHDIHHHLRTTTYGDDEVWALDSMDFNQAHHYGSDGNLADSAPIMARTAQDMTERFGKPFLMGEFGIDWKRSDAAHEPQGTGINLHNGMWGGLLGRSLGPPALWYWDNYIDRFDLWPTFSRVRAFADRVDWTTFRPEIVDVPLPVFINPPPPRMVDAPLLFQGGWRRQPAEPVGVARDGRLTGPEPSQFLFSPGKPEVATPLRLALDMPAAGTAVVRVGRVSSAAELVARVDGREVLRRGFTCGPPGEGEYTDSEWFEQWQLWQCTFNTEVSIALPAGQHVLELENASGDWMVIDRMVLPGYADASLPALDVFALADPQQAVGWLHDRRSHWQNQRDGNPPLEQPATRFTLPGVAAGEYTLTWFDPWQGRALGDQPLTVGGGPLELTTPAFTRDIAFHLQAR